MSAQRLNRPRVPLSVAIAVPVAAYALRSVLRGTAAPDVPGDLIVFGVWLAVLALAALFGSAAQRRRDDLAAEMHQHDGREGDARHDHEI